MSSFIKWLLSLFMKPQPMPEPTPVPIETPSTVVVRQAEAWLGRDASPNDEASDELGCADSVTSILRTIYKDFPHTVSTIELFVDLKSSRYFKATLTPSAGCVVVSPRIGAQPGHCGIFISSLHIASNNSWGANKGLWTQNYTFDEWVEYFKLEKGLHVYLFEPL